MFLHNLLCFFYMPSSIDRHKGYSSFCLCIFSGVHFSFSRSISRSRRNCWSWGTHTSSTLTDYTDVSINGVIIPNYDFTNSVWVPLVPCPYKQLELSDFIVLVNLLVLICICWLLISVNIFRYDFWSFMCLPLWITC